MKLIRSLLVSLLLASSSQADVFRILPGDREGGFELGQSFGASGWTVANGNQRNKWIVDSVILRPIGRWCAYVSDFDSEPRYGTDSASIVHFYRAFSVPNDAREVYLKFYVQLGGDSGRALYRAYVVPRNTPITPGVVLSFEPVVTQTTFRSGAFYSWKEVTRKLNVQPGTAYLLVFTWSNIALPLPVIRRRISVGIDNVELTYTRNNPLTSTWEWRNPQPQGNSLYSVLTIGPSTALAFGDAGTIGKTTDQGINWEFQHFVNGNRGRYVSPVKDGDNIYVVNQPFTYEISTDNGRTWQRMSTIGSGGTINAVAGRNGRHIAAGTSGQVHVSTNFGATWAARSSGTTEEFFSITLAPNEQTVIAGGNLNSLIKSTDGGMTFTLVPTSGLPPNHRLNYIVIDPSDPTDNTVYVGHSSGVYKSTNGGVTFVQTSGANTYTDGISMNPSNPSQGFAVGGQGRIHWTSNSWLSATSYSTGLQDWHRAAGYYTSSSTASLVGNSGTMHNTSNNGQTVTRISSGSRNGIRGFDWVAPPPGEEESIVYAATTGVPGAILKTTNRGRTWNEIALPPGPPTLLNAVVTPTENAVVAMGMMGRGVRSTNGGQTFSPTMLPSPLSMYDVKNYYVGTQLFIVAIGDGPDVFVSSDVGATWQAYPKNSPETMFGLALLIDFSEATTVQSNSLSVTDSIVMTAVGQSGKILKSTNGGQSWSPRSAPTMSNLLDVDFPDLLKGYAVGMSGTFLRTTDGGETWSQLSVNGITADFNAVSFISPDVGTIVANTGMILRTLNGGFSWDTLGSPTTNTLFDVVMLNPYTAIAGGSEGTIIMAGPDSIILVSVAEPAPLSLPGEVVLKQNYPNPFNATTTIRYELPFASVVDLKVVDMLGREVATLVNEMKTQGRHDVTWTANAMASGVYFYRLVAGKVTQTRKMLMIK